MKKIIIAGREFSYDNPFIVAEMGAFYYPKTTLFKMIKAAASAGASAVKFQTYSAETIAIKGERFKYSDGTEADQYEFFKKNELPKDLHFQLKEVAEKNGLIFFSSACDWPSLQFLVKKVKVPAIKIASQDCTNYPFLKEVGKTGLPVMLSTGVATLDEVKKAVRTLKSSGAKQLIINHCAVDYPCEVENLNLNVIKTYQETFPSYLIGFSDHSHGTTGPSVAASLGISFYERHFKLPGQNGPDSAVASDTEEFKEAVNAIKNAIIAKGASVKKIFKFEDKWKLVRKKIVLIRPKKAGQIITRKDVDIRRSPTGLSPEKLDYVIGRKIKKDINEVKGLLKSDLI